jgi:spore germination protein YaaH
VDVNKVSETLFEIILKARKQMISLRLDYDTVLAYDKLATVLNMKYNNNNTRITRTKLMQIILENAVKRPELIEELVSQKFGDGELIEKQLKEVEQR